MFSFLLKKKVANIAEEAQTIVRRTGGATGTILALGAYDVDPRLLMFVVQVAKDADREKLKAGSVSVSHLDYDWSLNDTGR